MLAQSAYLPLYKQIYDKIRTRIAAGEWAPGHSLPSEQALARELGASQGTVRKVLDILTAEHVLERRQGKGTFVAEHTDERVLFRFFRMVDEKGHRISPSLISEKIRARGAKQADRDMLDLASGARVVEIHRVRALGDRALASEVIVIPATVFPRIETDHLPNTLYSHYQHKYGVNVVRVDENLFADVASAEDQALLAIPLGAPLLCIHRIAISLNELKVEWRRSRLWAPDLSYGISIG